MEGVAERRKVEEGEGKGERGRGRQGMRKERW